MPGSLEDKQRGDRTVCSTFGTFDTHDTVAVGELAVEDAVGRRVREGATTAAVGEGAEVAIATDYLFQGPAS
jgi:hypothetical protein